MRRLRSTILLSLALATAAGCSRAIEEFREDLREEKRREREASGVGDGACGKGGRGRVNATAWQQRVDDFRAREFKGKEGFRNAKKALLADLAHERERACTWEYREVDDLIAQVRSVTY